MEPTPSCCCCGSTDYPLNYLKTWEAETKKANEIITNLSQSFLSTQVKIKDLETAKSELKRVIKQLKKLDINPEETPYKSGFLGTEWGKTTLRVYNFATKFIEFVTGGMAGVTFTSDEKVIPISLVVGGGVLIIFLEVGGKWMRTVYSRNKKSQNALKIIFNSNTFQEQDNLLDNQIKNLKIIKDLIKDILVIAKNRDLNDDQNRFDSIIDKINKNEKNVDAFATSRQHLMSFLATEIPDDQLPNFFLSVKPEDQQPIDTLAKKFNKLFKSKIPKYKDAHIQVVENHEDVKKKGQHFIETSSSTTSDSSSSD